jgi:hypothetical protein
MLIIEYCKVVSLQCDDFAGRIPRVRRLVRLRDLLVGGLGVIIDGRSLGDEGESVEEGVEETDDGESDCGSVV